MSEEPEDTRDGITRRQALKRMAAAGAVAWAAPAVQTMNMRRAWAQNESPQLICYRIKIETGGKCETGFGARDCLDPTSPDVLETEGGCDFFVTVTKDPALPDCIWSVTVADTCRIDRATAKTGPDCHEFEGSGTNTITINTCNVQQAISHVELMICCEETAP
ncbi:MAG TPA: hypothetical protein VF129_07605 [Actinomycetota bacterium]